MSEGKRRVRGAVGLTFEAVDQVTALVERTHHRVRTRTTGWLRHVPGVGEAANAVGAVEGVGSGLVYRTVRGVNGAVRGVAELTSALVPGSTPRGAAWVDDVESALNGAWGDFLAARGNLLDLGMSLRRAGAPVDLADPSQVAHLGLGRHVVLFVHGLAVHEGFWGLDLHEAEPPPDTFGARAAEELGFTPLFLRYNTGRAIAENGRALAELLEQLVAVHPEFEGLYLVGHSMGGLVVRSAAHQADVGLAPRAWRVRLRAVGCLGSPHLGAPLARAAALLEAGLRRIPAAGAEVPAELLAARSAGIQDLRNGAILDEHRGDGDPPEPLPPLEGVLTFYVAGSVASDPVHPLGQLLGDLLVPIGSASGRHSKRAVHFDAGVLLGELDHLQLCRDGRVWEAIRPMLEAAPERPAPFLLPLDVDPR